MLRGTHKALTVASDGILLTLSDGSPHHAACALHTVVPGLYTLSQPEPAALAASLKKALMALGSSRAPIPLDLQARLQAFYVLLKDTCVATKSVIESWDHNSHESQQQ